MCTPFPQSELMEWMLEDRRPEGCRLEGFEPLTCWTIAMDGPEGCPGLPSIYQGQTFRCAPCLLRVSLHWRSSTWGMGLMCGAAVLQ